MSTAYDGRLQRAIQDITVRYQAAGYFPSACVRVFNRDETLSSVCVGEAEENSLFDVASLTKIATATQILLLIQAGRLSLSTTLSAMLPAIAGDPFLSGRAGGITVRQLLTHTSTLPAWYPFYTAGEKEHDVWLFRKDKGVPVGEAVQKDILTVRDALGLNYHFAFEDK
jgi:hypothetical protein